MSSTDAAVELADVVRRFGDRLRAKVAIPPEGQRVLNAIAVCRTAALGGQRYACARCGYEHHVYHSCRNRHCPKCQQLAKAAWLEARQAELLPLPYFHLVFTVPHHLNGLMLANKRPMIALLFQAVSATLSSFGRRHLDGQVGFMAILHTWDQRLNPHFHLHVLIPAGALTEAGRAWQDASDKFLFPVKALSTVYRGKFLDGLKRLSGQGRLEHADPLRPVVEQSYAVDWVVYAKPPFGGPAATLSYLGRYTHRVAISNQRIVAIDADQVAFTFRNRRRGDRVETMRLDGVSFLRHPLLHVLPPRLVRIRYYGFLGNRVRGANVAKLRTLLADRLPPEPEPAADPPAQADRLPDSAPTARCPRCGQSLETYLIPAQKPWRRPTLLPFPTGVDNQHPRPP
jgi:hypothetical protein